MLQIRVQKRIVKVHSFIGKAVPAKNTEHLQKELPVGIGFHQVGEDGICTVSPLLH